MSALRRVGVRLLGAPAAGLAGTVLRLSPRRAGVVLLYHSIAVRSGDPARELVPPHRVDLFAGQLRHLRRWYRVVDAVDLLEAVRRRRRFGRFPVAITFDDDLQSHVLHALPTLTETGLRATFFICGASLDAPFAFWWERLQRRHDGNGSGDIHAEAEALIAMSPPERRAAVAGLEPDETPPDAGLRRADVRALVESGMTVGFHTRDHEPLSSLDDAALHRALRDGRHELEELVGARLAAIAYPHGARDDRVPAAARAAGFDAGFTASGDAVLPDSDPAAIPRIIPSHESVGRFAVRLVRELRG